MNGYNAIKKELEVHSELNTQVTTLFNLFLKSPKTEFAVSEFLTNLNLLRERGVLREWNPSTLKLEGGDAFFYLWFEYLQTLFPIKLDEDYKRVTEFIDKIEDYYRGQKIQSGLLSLVHKMEQWLIVTLNNDYDYDFHDYALTLVKDGKGRDIYDFVERFGKALPYLKISHERLIPIVLHLSIELNNNKNANPYGSLRIGLKDLVFGNPIYGIQLLNTLKLVKDSHEFEALVLSGLIEQGGVDYLNQIKDSYLEEAPNVLANSFSLLRKLNDTLADSVLSVTINFDLTKPNVVNYLPSIFYSIIQFTDCTTELKSKAFSSLKSAWTISKEIKPNILGVLENINGFENERRTFLLEAFDDEDVSISWIGNMYGLTEITTPDFIFDLILVIANRVRLQFDVKVLEYPLSELKRNDDGNFSHVLIQLLIHDNGFVRFAGSRIYTHITFGRGKFRFKYDILSLQETEQIKLVIAVLTEMNPPQDTLANILKLLDSPYKRVVDILILKLKTMVESFFDSVNIEMQLGIEENIFSNTTALKIVHTHHEQFLKHIEDKKKLKEFNPLLNEYNLAKYYSETVHRKNSRMINEVMNNNSVISHMGPTINLTKGGGWKVEGRESVQQLGHISSSAPFPRIYFIAPEYLDRVIANKYLVNWKQIFKWEQIQ